MNDPIAVELAKARRDLRATEDQLGQARRRVSEVAAENMALRRRLAVAEARVQALEIHEAITRIPAQPPDPDACGEYLYEKPIRDVTTGGLL